MSVLGTLLAAERVKWRKSWVLVATILAPLCQTAFIGLLFWFSESRVRMFRPGYRFWLELNFVLWNLVVLPLGAALVCEISWEQERDARAWNRLLTQPHPWQAHFAVKLVGHFILLLSSLALFAASLLLGGALLQQNSELLMGELPLALFTTFMGYSALALVPIVAFHTWLSMRVPGTWVALTLALAGSWLAIQLVGQWRLLTLLPWGLAAQASIVFERWRVLPWSQASVALLLGSTLGVLGMMDFAHRRETQA